MSRPGVHPTVGLLLKAPFHIGRNRGDSKYQSSERDSFGGTAQGQGSVSLSVHTKDRQERATAAVSLPTQPTQPRSSPLFSEHQLSVGSPQVTPEEDGGQGEEVFLEQASADHHSSRDA